MWEALPLPRNVEESFTDNPGLALVAWAASILSKRCTMLCNAVATDTVGEVMVEVGGMAGTERNTVDGARNIAI